MNSLWITLTVASEANTGAEQEPGNIKVTHKASHRIETIK